VAAEQAQAIGAMEAAASALWSRDIVRTLAIFVHLVRKVVNVV